jgi:hypothetical protein
VHVLDPDVRKHRPPADQGYPLYCAQPRADGSRLLLCGGSAPQRPKFKTGLRRAPPSGAGCLRVSGDDADHLNPWFSLDLDTAWLARAVAEPPVQYAQP